MASCFIYSPGRLQNAYAIRSTHSVNSTLRLTCSRGCDTRSLSSCTLSVCAESLWRCIGDCVHASSPTLLYSLFSSLAQVRTEGILTWRMPNQLNMAFDYATALVCFALLYIPCECFVSFWSKSVSLTTYSLPTTLLLHVRTAQESAWRRRCEEARIVIAFLQCSFVVQSITASKRMTALEPNVAEKSLRAIECP